MKLDEELAQHFGRALDAALVVLQRELAACDAARKAILAEERKWDANFTVYPDPVNKTAVAPRTLADYCVPLPTVCSCGGPLLYVAYESRLHVICGFCIPQVHIESAVKPVKEPL